MTKILFRVSLLGVMLYLGACVTGGVVATVYDRRCDPSDDGECKKQLMIRACTETANSYPYVRDRLLYEQYGALFTENALFQIEGGPQATGREAIVQALRERGPASKVRHTSTVVNMQVTGENAVSGISYVTIWQSSNDAAKTSAGEPWIQGEYHDDYVFQDQRCLIAERVVKIVFRTD